MYTSVKKGKVYMYIRAARACAGLHLCACVYVYRYKKNVKENVKKIYVKKKMCWSSPCPASTTCCDCPGFSYYRMCSL